MQSRVGEDEVVLVLDTCGDRASFSLHRGTALIAEKVLAERSASQSILGGLRELLQQHNLCLAQLAGVGVVHGPGSFTGVRVGLALAKGLCEAASLTCAPVSRLAVLAHAAELFEGYALLPAGRGQVYVRVMDDSDAAVESMQEVCNLLPLLTSRIVAVADAELAELLKDRVVEVRVVKLTAQRAIRPVLACLAQGGADLATLDANYVRDEGAIYRQAAALSPYHA